MYLRYFFTKVRSCNGNVVGYQHRGSASRLVEDAYRVLEDVFRLNVSASHQLVSAVFVAVSAYRARVFTFFISCFENLGGLSAFAQVTRINTVAVSFNDKALGL